MTFLIHFSDVMANKIFCEDDWTFILAAKEDVKKESNSSNPSLVFRTFSDISQIQNTSPGGYHPIRWATYFSVTRFANGWPGSFFSIFKKASDPHGTTMDKLGNLSQDNFELIFEKIFFMVFTSPNYENSLFSKTDCFQKTSCFWKQPVFFSKKGKRTLIEWSKRYVQAADGCHRYSAYALLSSFCLQGGIKQYNEASIRLRSVFR